MCTALALPPMPRRSDPPRPRDETVALTDRLRLAMATAGHDLRQPLQILVGAVERLGRLASDETDRMWRDAALHQVTRLSKGLEGLSDAARQPREAHRPQCRSVRIGDLLATVADDFRAAATTRGLALRVVDCAVMVQTDPDLLAAALRNLVANAVKYTPAGGIVIGCRRRPGRFRIDVIDTGVGIAAADRPTIFDAYRQLDAAADGVGLGLYLVRTQCAALGHDLACVSTPGRGSRFSIGIAR